MAQRLGWCVMLVLLPIPAAGGEPARVDVYGDPLPPRALARLGTRRLRHDVFLVGAAYAPDGKNVAAVSYDSRLILWNLSSGKALYRDSDPGSRCGDCRLLFSSDGKWLASTGYRNVPPIRFQVFEAATGKVHLRDRQIAGSPLAISADGKTAASVRGERTVVLWDLPSGKEKQKPVALPGKVHALGFARDGGVLAVVEEGQTIGLWGVAAEKRRCSLPRFDVKLYTAAVSLDCQYIALGGANAFLALYDVKTGQELHRLPGLEHRVWHAAFSPNSRMILGGDNTGNTCVWDVASGKRLWKLTNTPGKGVFSPDSKTVTEFGLNGPHGLQFFEAATGKEIRPFPGHLSTVTTVAFSPDGRRILTSDQPRQDPAALLWDARTGKVIREFRGHPWGVGSAVFSPDGKWAATAAWHGDPHVRIWDVEMGSERRCLLIEPPEFAEKAVFSPNGKWLAACWQSGRKKYGLIVWEVESGKVVRKIAAPGREITVHALAFSPDGRTIVRGATDGLRIWDTVSGVELLGLEAELPPRRRAQVGGLAFSPDGRLLATGWYGGARLCETATRQAILDLPTTSALAFSPDGRFLALGMREKLIRVFDVAAGCECLRFSTGTKGADCVAFSPDGKRLVSGSGDSTALVWDVSDLPQRAARLAVPRTESETLPALWADLGGSAKAAHRAAADLASSGDSAAEYLGAHLAKAKPLDPELLPGLIRDLDADAFRTREAASKRLQDWGMEVDDALRRALGGRLSPEQKRRIEAILATRATSPTVSEEVRFLRAIAVLERIGSPQAQRILRKLTKGASAARLTIDAKAALERLTKSSRER